MMQQQASSLSGLIIFLAVILFQLYSAYRRGKVEPEEPVHQPAPPGPRPGDPPPRPAAQKPKPLTGKSLEQLFEELSKGLEPEIPTRPQPPVLPQPRPRATPPRLPAAREPQSRDLQNDPAGLIARGGSPLYATSVESINEPLGDIPVTTSAGEEAHRFVWLREQLRNRAETQRAIILNEVLQPPMALR
jgi:hypothetical protein